METKRSSILGEEIRLDLICKIIWQSRKKYVLPLLVTAVVTSLLALSVPRYYTAEVKLAPEYSSPAGGLSGGLGGMASMLGLNMNSLSSTDAITPTFYPDVLGSTDFLVPLLGVEIRTKEDGFRGPYYEYLTKHLKAPWWIKAVGAVKHLFEKKDGAPAATKALDPFQLTKKEMEVMRLASNNIDCVVDKKTDVITITTTAQDPLAAALLADTVRSRLQAFILDYRTSKARNDLQHIEKLCEEAYAHYRKTQKAYAGYADSHQELVLQSYKSEEEVLENEMQLAYNTYNTLQQQRQLALAKLQERTPAFTTIQNATVPVKHAGPKRMLLVLAMCFLAFFACSVVFVSRYSKEAGQ